MGLTGTGLTGMGRLYLAVAIAAIMLLGWPDASPLLRWDRAALADGELWRMVSAHFVHLNGRHLLANLIGLALVTELLGAASRPAEALFILLVSALAISAGLSVFSPGIVWYAGLSGLVHGLWAGLALLGWRHGQRALPCWALAALLIKLAWPSGLTGDLPVVPQAHAYGAVGGLAAALLLQMGRYLSMRLGMRMGMVAGPAGIVSCARRAGAASVAVARWCFRLE